MVMGAPAEYFAELARDIAQARSQSDLDILLDEWYDASHRATDWDAVEWGFDPRRWMSEDRKLMEIRIADARRRERQKSR